MSKSEPICLSIPQREWDSASPGDCHQGSGTPRVLYMEDDAGLARLVQKKLEQAGYIVDLARDGEEGLAMCAAGSYDVVAVDYRMPVHDGLEVIRILASQGSLPPMVMITGTGSEKVAVEAMKAGARDYVVKDMGGRFLDLLPAVIEHVLQQQRLIEERQWAMEALRQRIVELQARNEELDAFAYTVAHDLKNLLGHVIGFAQLLERNYAMLPEEELLSDLRTIVQSGCKMSDIIDGLLLLAGVRKMKVNIEPLDMASIVAEVQQRLAHEIEEYQARIILPSTWPVALGYGPWVEEVWANYLSNAIKYGGRPPRIELGFSTPVPEAEQSGILDSPSPKGGHSKIQNQKSKIVCFWVRDNGPGLTPEEQARLFTPFVRLHQTRAKGHGLGLSIVRRIVEKLDGQVGSESEAGQGSVFTFTLPTQGTTTGSIG